MMTLDELVESESFLKLLWIGFARLFESPKIEEIPETLRFDIDMVYSIHKNINTMACIISSLVTLSNIVMREFTNGFSGFSGFKDFRVVTDKIVDNVKKRIMHTTQQSFDHVSYT